MRGSSVEASPSSTGSGRLSAMPARKSERPPASPDSLKRQRAGTYTTADGRFTVESSSSGWLLLDGEQTDELGLPLARGPFTTLDAAKAAIGAARSGPAPTFGLPGRAGGRAGRTAARSKSPKDRDASPRSDEDDARGDDEEAVAGAPRRAPSRA